ncbi:hypothetical protein O3P69_019814 [Scylla paramamosain]|uniref:Uncharacterized protein n=1 Tax=Scylla paramamosain TaxID=85552 RepID=A0AAW0SIJ7_SCYPA
MVDIDTCSTGGVTHSRCLYVQHRHAIQLMHAELRGRATSQQESSCESQVRGTRGGEETRSVFTCLTCVHLDGLDDRRPGEGVSRTLNHTRITSSLYSCL